jgi:hypothetical protein
MQRPASFTSRRLENDPRKREVLYPEIKCLLSTVTPLAVSGENHLIEDELSGLLETAKSGSDEEAGRAIRTIMLSPIYRESAVSRILKEIDSDELEASKRLKHSPRWNDLGLAYLAKDATAGLEILLHVARRESDSPATFNNVGCAFATLGLHDRAREWFTRAYLLDKKAFKEKAEQHPAYRNLQIIENFRKAWAARLSREEPRRLAVESEGPHGGRLKFEKAKFWESFVFDFLMGGVVAGLVLTIATAIIGLADRITQMCVYVVIFVIAVLGLYAIYRRAR